MGDWNYSCTILDLGTRWRCVIRFTHRPFCPRGKRPWCPSYRRLAGPQSLSGRCGLERDHFLLPGIELPAVHTRSSSLYRLSYPDSRLSLSLKSSIIFSVCFRDTLNLYFSLRMRPIFTSLETKLVIYRITLNIRLIFYTFFPVEKLGCILNSRNVHLSDFFSQKPTFKNWLHLKFECILYSK
jgi:hypothetical protein